MALSNHDRVGKALALMRDGLAPFVAREIKSAIALQKIDTHRLVTYAGNTAMAQKPMLEWDVAGLLKIMWGTWNEIFRNTLGHAERSLVSELRTHRNSWAHQERFSSDDAYRMLDSAERLLVAISASQAQEIERLRMELLRVRFDQQVRDVRRKKVGRAITSASAVALKPWREVITPHKDVASGRYQQAEFAADLWQVHIGEGPDEYRDPSEFFRRTFLTNSLEGLLIGAIRRLAGKGGDPVVQLQTNFGGGKTHSMLALYHMFSGKRPGDMEGVRDMMAKAGETELAVARRVVLVGNKISPGNPIIKPDGTQVRTLWGELAWQLGGRKAFDRVAADDKYATNPGDALRVLFRDYGPCLILIDEWVAYARQLHDQSDLPAGGFETQFSFAQALTESAKLAKNCLLVISLPASDTSGTIYAHADDVEVGGRRGREALERLQNVVGRIESSWRPATAEEGFEIVRRRLFEPIRYEAQYKDRDVVARAFVDFYRDQRQEFPAECCDADYERRIKDAYPIHPEVFDRLYTDWSTLVKFQRTRGVLRLMASVIHNLWRNGDRNPLILPSNIAIEDALVQSELTRYLAENWTPVIAKDVDGPNSLPVRIDGDVPNLGKVFASRRVARTIYLGSAPTENASHQGIEDRRIKLGSVLPGESPAVFGDALRRLATAATYLYQDGARYWYSTRPTVTKMAEEIADSLRREPGKVLQELENRLRKNLRDAGDFRRVHCLPQSTADVPDERAARLVVIGVDHPYSKEQGNAAEAKAKAILETRGSAPRIYRNTLVFLVADKTRWQDLDKALRKFLAWETIADGREAYDLSSQQEKQARNRRDKASELVAAQIPETYRWLLAPGKTKPDAPVEWRAIRLSGTGSLAVKASEKLRREEALVIRLAPSRLRMELDGVPLWRERHVAVRQLAEDFARYLYLPRLKDTSVLRQSISAGIGLLSWDQDAFAYADNFDEEKGRYQGLVFGSARSLTGAGGILVKPDIALRQSDSEHRLPVDDTDSETGDGVIPPGEGDGGIDDIDTISSRRLTRYHGSVTLDSARVGSTAGKVADEVIAHLAGLVGANVTVKLEIHAEVPEGVSDDVVRIVMENSTTLKFNSHGFEED